MSRMQHGSITHSHMNIPVPVINNVRYDEHKYVTVFYQSLTHDYYNILSFP